MLDFDVAHDPSDQEQRIGELLERKKKKQSVEDICPQRDCGEAYPVDELRTSIPPLVDAMLDESRALPLAPLAKLDEPRRLSEAMSDRGVYVPSEDAAHRGSDAGLEMARASRLAAAADLHEPFCGGHTPPIPPVRLGRSKSETTGVTERK